MVLKIKRENREPVQSLIRRFTKAVQESGILLRARKKQFKTRNISEDLKRATALRREKKKAEYEKIKKMGKPI